MTKIELSNGYFLEVDPMCFTLKRIYKGKKKGVEQDCESVHGYFGTLSQAVEKFLHLNKLDKSPDKAFEFREYVEKVELADRNAVRAITKAWRAMGGD